MSTNFYSAYLESSVLSATPLQLIHLSYQGAIEAILKARQDLADKRILDRSQSITKAQLILMELSRCLDMARGGALSTRLASLYDYMLKRLNVANSQQIEAPLAEVQQLLETLDEAWQEIATPATSIAATASSSPWATSADTSVRLNYSL